MNCPACTSRRCAQIAHIEKLPAIVFPAEPEDAEQVVSAPFNAASCADCGHIFATGIDEEFIERLYRDYYHLYPFDDLESLNAAYRDPFERAFRYVFGDGDYTSQRLLEIGCSTAKQLHAFSEMGFHCTGISPGAQPDEHIEMIDAFYERHAMDAEYDVIVSRFSLEHVIDLDRFLDKVSGDLASDGRLFIQVPNARHFMDLGILNIFAHEHTHYFSAASLRALLERRGFDCLLSGSADAPSLIVAAEKTIVHTPNDQYFRATAETRSKVQELIKTNAGQRVVFYGAGLSLTGILYADGEGLAPASDMHLVDDNELLQGRQMPGFPVPVQMFHPELFDDAVVIVTLSPIYHHRVLLRLKETAARALYLIDRSGNLIDTRKDATRT